MNRSLPVVSEDFGLYLHVPFCSFLCHYCDFAKTARWDDELVKRYFASLGRQLQAWLEELAVVGLPKFTSVNIGGGTPSLFTQEYAPLLAQLAPFLAANAELSLEANPADLTVDRLRQWKELGFNRLSLGVQTLRDEGLSFLKRDHTSGKARAAIELALQHIPNVNVDLIYSWQGQSAAVWQEDLREMVRAAVPHLSLYNLTYAEKTPLGRAQARGRLAEAVDEEQEAFYELARAFLGEHGYEHDEVSNWAKPGFTCRHNWLYWRAAHYLGIGLAASGFLPAADHQLGLRYAYTNQMRAFLQLQELPWHPFSLRKGPPQAGGALVVESRDEEAWLMEYIGCGLRCREGIDLAKIAAHLTWVFEPSPVIKVALAEGKLCQQGQRLTLIPQEWFRETAWSLAVLACFEKDVKPRQ